MSEDLKPWGPISAEELLSKGTVSLSNREL